jgi:hypothetical protein
MSRTYRTGQSEQDSQKRLPEQRREQYSQEEIDKTVQLGYESQNRKVRTGSQDNQDRTSRTARIGAPVQASNRTAKTGQPENNNPNWTAEQDKHNKTARTGQPVQDSEDRSAWTVNS